MQALAVYDTHTQVGNARLNITPHAVGYGSAIAMCHSDLCELYDLDEFRLTRTIRLAQPAKSCSVEGPHILCYTDPTDSLYTLDLRTPSSQFAHGPIDALSHSSGVCVANGVDRYVASQPGRMAIHSTVTPINPNPHYSEHLWAGNKLYDMAEGLDYSHTQDILFAGHTGQESYIVDRTHGLWTLKPGVTPTFARESRYNCVGGVVVLSPNGRPTTHPVTERGEVLFTEKERLVVRDANQIRYGVFC